jgi:ribosomal protein L11 methyltransferase
MSDGCSGDRVWTKVVIEAHEEAIDEVAAFLTDLTGTGIEVVTSNGEGPSPREHLHAYLGGAASSLSGRRRLDVFLKECRRRSRLATPRLLRSETVPEEDWRQNWKSHFKVTKLTPRLVVRPPWTDAVPAKGERVIEIDPGMAFGTGLHASTRLVLEFIDELYREVGDDCGPVPEEVLDVGTGTGILAMACALFGARRVVAIDNDRQAVAAAAGNVGRNGLEGTVEASEVDLKNVSGSFDLIVANILHDTLAGISSVLAGKLSRSGTFLCGGILAGDQEENLLRLYERLGLRHRESKHEGEWAALRFTGKD